MTSFFLLESGDTLLLESGDALALEDHVAAVSSDSNPLTLTVREAQALAIREGRRMTNRITRHRNAERPATTLEIKDGTGDLIDFSTGYTFSFKIGEVSASALLIKTSGITGAATSPNITIAWAAGELDLAPGTYLWQLTATTSSADRVYEGAFVVLDVIGSSSPTSGGVDEIDGGAP